MYGAGAGHAEAGIEVISIAVDAIGATVKPKLRTHPIVGSDAAPARKGARRAYFTGKSAGYRDAAIYDYTGPASRQPRERARDHRDAVHDRCRAGRASSPRSTST